MDQVKDTLRATVRLSYDGRVFKTFRGPHARERFENEGRVLRHLEVRGCPFVPRLLEADPETLRIVTTNCGTRVERIDPPRRGNLRVAVPLRRAPRRRRDAQHHLQPRTGNFCVIDFEFARIFDGPTPPPPQPADDATTA